MTYVTLVANALRGALRSLLRVLVTLQGRTGRGTSADAFRAFLQSNSAIAFIKDPDGRYVEVNDRFLQHCGLHAKDVIEHTDADLFAADYAQQIRANDQKVLATGSAIEVEETVRDGEPLLTFLVCKFPMRDDQGRIAVLGGIAMDVSERKKAESAAQASEKRLRLITDNVPALIAYIDTEERYRFVNSTAELWHGKSRRVYPGRTIREMQGEEAYAEIKDYVRRALAGQTVAYQRKMFESTLPRHVDAKYIPDFGDDGAVAGFYVMINDISRLKEAERTLRESEARFRAMNDASPLGLFVTDASGRGTYVNDRFCSVTGMSLQQVRNQGWTAGIHADDRPGVSEAWAKAVEKQAMCERDCRFIRSDGTEVWTQIKVNPFRDGTTTLGYVGTVEDITKRKQVEHHLTHLAQYDALTGLPNRNLFHDRLAQALERRARSGHLFALMYLDVDHFKSINDTLGHVAGDALLKGFADRLKHVLRGSDTVARLGGDEFVILIEELHERENATMIAQKIVDAVREPFDIGGRPLKITASVGLAFPADMSATAEDLIEHADKALYLAKRAGRDRYEVTSPIKASTLRLPLPV